MSKLRPKLLTVIRVIARRSTSAVITRNRTTSLAVAGVSSMNVWYPRNPATTTTASANIQGRGGAYDQ